MRRAHHAGVTREGTPLRFRPDCAPGVRDDGITPQDPKKKAFGQCSTCSSTSTPARREPMDVPRDECRLYLITPPAFDPKPFADLLAAALDAGDVAAVQLRLKDVDDDTWRRAIDVLGPISQARNVAFLLNDRADLARETGCDGAHVGQDDMPAREARRMLGPDLMLGVTCHASRDLRCRPARTALTMSLSARSFLPVLRKPRHAPRPTSCPGGQR